MLEGRIGRYPHTYRLLEAPLALGDEPLTFRRTTPGQTAREMIRTLSYDVVEMPIVNYFAARESGVAMTAIPVFLSRRFPQPMIVVNRRSGIRSPADLAAARIGIGYYGNSDTAWVQVMLSEQFGLDCDDITWVASQGPQVPRPTPANVVAAGDEAETLATDGLAAPRLGALLAAGELDAVVYGVPNWDHSNPDLVPLLDPPDAAIENWWRLTSAFPILHTLAIADRVVQAQAEVPVVLQRAFDTELAAARADLAAATRDTDLALAAVRTGIAPVRGATPLRAAGDPFAYGLAANRAQLELLVEHAVRLSLLDRRPDLDAAFHPVI